MKSRMKPRQAYIILLLTIAVSYVNNSIVAAADVFCVDPLVKVFRSDTALPTTSARADAAVGEHATIQFVFRSSTAVKDLRASVSGDIRGARPRFVGYVSVKQRYKGAPADTLSSADRQFPDPLLEDQGIAVAAGQNQPIWITVRAEKPGEFRGQIDLHWAGGEASRPFTVFVHHAKMQKPRLWVTNWWFADAERLSMLAGHKVEPFSDEYWKLLRQIADFMAGYHQNVVMVSPLNLVTFRRHEEKWSFDFSRFDKTVEAFIAAGVIGRIEGGHIGGRGGKDWKSGFIVHVPQPDGRLTNVPATSPEARAFYQQFFPALAEHLKGRGWDKLYRQHLADEPIDANAASYADLARLLHEFAPGIRVMEATQTPSLVGSVNTWVPVLDHLHRDYDFFRQRQKAGDEVWLYTCCKPTGDYANRFIEQPLIKPRLLHWINFRYGATGYLHWGFNYWQPGQSPFGETMFRWPGGDQWIVYPKDGKLLSSIRLEAMRDGICDHELLSMLAERDPESARKLAAGTILDFNRYDTDVGHFRATRLQLLESISAATVSAPASR